VRGVFSQTLSGNPIKEWSCSTSGNP